MGWLVSAGIVGLISGIWWWRRMNKAERDAITVERQKDLLAGDKQADLDEVEISERAKTARDSAAPDFSGLR
jgi:hypothetical protein